MSILPKEAQHKPAKFNYLRVELSLPDLFLLKGFPV